MVVKTTIKTPINHKALLKRIENQSKATQIAIKRKWSTICAVEVKKLILKDIARGYSPVLGEKNFKKYSQIYKDLIKRGKGVYARKKERPVNLRVTGGMLDSLKSEAGRNSFSHEFTSPIAEYHNKEGVGKSKTIRRMLPRRGETYNLKINKKIKEILRDVIRTTTRRK